MAVSYKAITGEPIKSGGVLFYIPGVGRVINNRRAVQLSDNVLIELNNLLDQVGRNRFYYTTGDPDPPDPT
jgi:hypothetical protein